MEHPEPSWTLCFLLLATLGAIVVLLHLRTWSKLESSLERWLAGRLTDLLDFQQLLSRLKENPLAATYQQGGSYWNVYASLERRTSNALKLVSVLLGASGVALVLVVSIGFRQDIEDRDASGYLALQDPPPGLSACAQVARDCLSLRACGEGQLCLPEGIQNDDVGKVVVNVNDFLNFMIEELERIRLAAYTINATSQLEATAANTRADDDTYVALFALRSFLEQIARRALGFPNDIQQRAADLVGSASNVVAELGTICEGGTPRPLTEPERMAVVVAARNLSLHLRGPLQEYVDLREKWLRSHLLGEGPERAISDRAGRRLGNLLDDIALLHGSTPVRQYWMPAPDVAPCLGQSPPAQPRDIAEGQGYPSGEQDLDTPDGKDDPSSDGSVGNPGDGNDEGNPGGKEDTARHGSAGNPDDKEDAPGGSSAGSPDRKEDDPQNGSAGNPDGKKDTPKGGGAGNPDGNGDASRGGSTGNPDGEGDASRGGSAGNPDGSGRSQSGDTGGENPEQLGGQDRAGGVQSPAAQGDVGRVNYLGSDEKIREAVAYLGGDLRRIEVPRPNLVPGTEAPVDGESGPTAPYQPDSIDIFEDLKKRDDAPFGDVEDPIFSPPTGGGAGTVEIGE